MARRPVVSVFRSLGFLAVLGAAVPLTAAAQTVCDDNTRQAYQTAVDAGATEADLEKQFGHCRGTGTQTVTATITNANISYEKMNSCGLHPQSRVATCDVEIRRTTGYGPFGPPPAGSFERARFCFDCNVDGIYESNLLTQVHVTNNVSASVPSWYHSVFVNAGNLACPWNSGRMIRMRVILSWAGVPPMCNLANPLPIWGNRIDFQARMDP